MGSDPPARSTERVFPATVDEVPEIVAFVTTLAEQAGLPPKKLMHLELAVEEAVTNISHYAYEKPSGSIAVAVKKANDRFIVEFVDEGLPFDPLARADPTLSPKLEDRPMGGLGIFLIRRVMDEVQYRREGGRNVLTLVVSACP